MYFTNTPRPQQYGGDHEKTALRHTERRRSVSQVVSIHQERLRLQTLSLLVRQILQCVVVESKQKIKVVFIGGLEVECDVEQA